MDTFRNESLIEVAGIEVEAEEDYATSIRVAGGVESQIHLQSSNVLKYYLAVGSCIFLRPSGTEPKAKFYFGVKGQSMEQRQEKLATIQTAVMNKVNDILEARV